MDGRGRATDNIYIELFWRSVKQGIIYLNACETGSELYRGLKIYFEFYNKKRPHQSLDYVCPLNVYKENLKKFKVYYAKKTLSLRLEKRKNFSGRDGFFVHLCY
jgi:putative transposase